MKAEGQRRPAVVVNQAADWTRKHKTSESPRPNLPREIVSIDLASDQIYGNRAIERIILGNNAAGKVCAKGIHAIWHNHSHGMARIKIPDILPGARYRVEVIGWTADEQAIAGAREGHARISDRRRAGRIPVRGRQQVEGGRRAGL